MKIDFSDPSDSTRYPFATYWDLSKQVNGLTYCVFRTPKDEILIEVTLDVGALAEPDQTELAHFL